MSTQSDQSTSPVQPGDILADKYRVENVLGVGGMGIVVAAMHLQLEQRVALKFLLPQALSNTEVVARFTREARAAVRIKSEHVARVIDGIFAAREAGLAIKINMVALKGLNEHEIAPMLDWCVEHCFDLTLIETMPLGAIDEDRVDRFLPLTEVFDRLQGRFDLVREIDRTTGGPARYWRVGAGATRLGLISPLTANFCDGCNRVRLTTEGKLYMCLGHDDRVDLKAALQNGGIGAVDDAIDRAMMLKPKRHDFRIVPGAAPAVERHMSVTGG